MDHPGQASITLEEAKLDQHSFELICFLTCSWSDTVLDYQQFLRCCIGTKLEISGFVYSVTKSYFVYMLSADRVWPEKHLAA